LLWKLGYKSRILNIIAIPPLLARRIGFPVTKAKNVDQFL